MEAANKIIAYYRVSTKRQNLGLEAQRSAVHEYAAAHDLQIIDEISEKESGREDARPGINLAIAKARKTGATLVASKADRISRDISFAAWVFFKSGIHVRALNLPDEAYNDPLIFGVYYGLAQKEAQMISERTKAALDKVKERYQQNTMALLQSQGIAAENVTPELYEKTARENGWKLGRPGWSIEDNMTSAAATAKKQKADSNPANVAAAQELRRFFASSTKRNLSAAARHLNDKQLYTSRGVFHTAMSVKLLIKRYAI